jgi:hypothetical protein
MRREEEEEDGNRGRGGVGRRWVSPMLGVIGETCSWRGAAVLTIAIAAVMTVRAASTDKELADHQRAAERDERD